MAISPNRVDREKAKFREDSSGNTVVAVNDTLGGREAGAHTNLKTLEMLGITLDNYVVVNDEIVTLSDGTLVKVEV